MLNYSDTEALAKGWAQGPLSSNTVVVFFLSEDIVREQSSQETLKLWLHAALTIVWKSILFVRSFLYLISGEKHTEIKAIFAFTKCLCHLIILHLNRARMSYKDCDQKGQSAVMTGANPYHSSSSVNKVKF